MRRLLALLAACTSSAPQRVTPIPPPLRPTPAVVTPSSPASEPLAYLDTALATIAARYVDPNRFDYRKMLAGGLDGMEREIAEVITAVANDRVNVRVNDQERNFAGDVDSLAELGIRLTEIVEFVQANANKSTKAFDIELGTVNGMLRTLDPHTFAIPPDEMREWEIGLSGKFGGVGIVIGVRADRITAVEVHPNTPAQRGGVQAGDVIAGINGQSTEAFTVDEAVTRLRGDPGTRVKVSLERSGKKLEVPITRAEIRIPVVKSKLLAGGVGLVSLERFDADTAAELRRAMESLRGQGAKAWVIDLRENGGGYLAQAVRSADLFVDTGVIVATVAGGKKHDIKHAKPGGVDTRSPVVVLIGNDTASSAEVLAGALKQLDRAILVGRTTFGKGSVQILEDAPRGGKLKVTTAEYISANDISLQGTGIAPDIELVPAVVPKQVTDTDPVRLQPPKPFREADLGAVIATTQTIDKDKPIATIRYRARGSDTPDTPDKDFEVAFARELALSSRAGTRADLLRDAAKLAARVAKDADRGIVDGLKILGIDWRSARRTGRGRSKLVAKLPASLTGTSGERFVVEGGVTNTGKQTASRVIARATSDDSSLDGIELVFGSIAPGATKRASAAFKLPRSSASRVGTITWQIVDASGTDIAAATTVQIAGKPPASLSLVTELVDDNDGIPNRGETVRLRVAITNRGSGRAATVVATLRSLVGERVLVDRGRVDAGALEPGQAKTVELAFTPAKDLGRDQIALELDVENATQRLEIDLGKRATAWSHTPPRVRIDDVPLETTADTIRVTGVADDETLVRDVIVETSNRAASRGRAQLRKVFYAAGTKPQLSFAADVPLAPGPNRILVIAREHDKSQTIRAVWVYRR